MKTLPLTAGNVLFHATFPAQMFIMGLFMLLLVFGAFQLVIGPLPAGKFLFLRVDDLRALAARLAALLAIVAALELCRTVVAGAILAPEKFLDFFARGQTPLTDPVGLALLTAATVIGTLVLVLLARRRP